MSTKLANASQQDTATTSDQITALMNAYGLDNNMSALNSALDSWAEVANVSAADVSELAQASQKAAASARTMGVSTDQLNGQIATIESVTREAPEQIGNGLKTLYARFSDLKMGKTLEDGVSLGAVTQQLQDIGVQVMGQDGQMRNVGDIMEELMDVWKTLDQTQKAAVSQTLAGKYQVARFQALMERSDLYDQYKGASENADGTLDEMNSKFTDSLEGRMNKLKATVEDLFNSLFDSDSFYGLVDLFTNLINIVDKFTDAIGGSGQALLLFGNIGLKTFGKNITDWAAKSMSNKSVNQQQKIDQATIMNQAKADGYQGFKDSDPSKDKHGIIEHYSQINQRLEYMSEEDTKVAKEIAERKVAAANQLDELEDLNKTRVLITNAASAAVGTGKIVDYDNESGKIFEAKDAQITLNDLEENSSSLRTKSVASALGSLDVSKADTIAYQLQSLIENFSEISGAKIGEVAEGILDLGGKMESLNKELGGAFDEPIAKIDKMLNTLGDIDDKSDPAMKEVIKDIQQIASEAGNASEKLKEAVIAVKKTGQPIAPILDASSKAQANVDVDNANAANEAADKKLVNFTDFMDTKAGLDNIIKMTAAVNDLGFAFISIQNIGSIWQNSDLNGGEKLLQTIMNLSIAVPQLISGFSALNDIKKDLKFDKVADNLLDLGQKYKEINESASKGAILQEMVGLKIRAVGTLSKTAAKGVSLLGSALKVLTSPAFIVGTAVVGTLLSIGNAIKKAAEEAREAKITAGEEISQKNSDASAQKNNFDSLYEQYKKGKASSDDLKNAADSLNQVLDDQSLKALALTGNWEAYAQAVDKAAQKQAQQNQAQMQIAAQASDDKFNDAIGMWDKTSTKMQSYGANIQDKNVIDTYNDQKAISRTVMGQYGFVDGSSAAERVQALDDMLAALNEAMESATGKELETIQAEKDKLLELSAKYSDEINTVRQSAQNEGQNAVIAYGNDEDYAIKENESIDQYKSRLMETGQFTSEQAVQAFIDGMANANYDSSNVLAQKLGQESAEEALSNELNSKIKNSLDNPSGQIYQQLKSSHIDTSMYGDEISNALTESIISQISESGLTSEDQQKLLNGIDWSKPLEEILGYISQGIKTGDVSSLSNPEFGEGDKERHTDLVENYDIDEGTIATYKDLQEETTALGDARDELADKSAKAAEEAEKIKETEGENSKAYKKAAMNARNAQNELEAYNDTQEDLVELSLQSQKGMESLIESFEDNAKVLRSGEKNTLEYAEAMDETREAVADLVNTSSERITPEFITDNLDDIERAVNGDTDAIGRLRAAAANQILLEMQSTGNLTPENLDYLQSKAIELSSMTIEPNAVLNDADFVNTLNKMRDDGQASAEQIQAYLNSIGFDPIITMEQKESVAFRIPGKHFSAELFGKEFAAVDIPDIEIMGITEVPKITSLQSAGGGGGHSAAGGVAKSPSRPASRGGGGGGGSRGGGGKGGGSGSTPKAYEPKDNKEHIDKEIDRYEKVNAELEKTTEAFDRLGNEQGRLTGFELADNLKKQNTLLQKQIRLHKQKLEIQKQELEETKNILGSQYGITFDTEGFMNNYASVHQQLINDVNRIGDKYSSATSEEAEKAIDKEYDLAQKRLENFEKYYERYDELFSSGIEDTISQLEELEDKIEDLAIDAFNKSVESLDKIKDIQGSLEKFNHSMNRKGLDDDPIQNAQEHAEQLGKFFDIATSKGTKFYDTIIAKEKEAAKNSKTEEERKWHESQASKYATAKANYGTGKADVGGTGYIDMSMDNVQSILEQVRQYEDTGYSTIFGENGQALYDTAAEVLSQAADTVDELWGKIEDLQDDILDMIDKVGEALEERQQQYENITNELEHQADIVEKVYGDKAYAQLDKIYAAQNKNYQAQMDELKKSIDKQKEMLAMLPEGSKEYKALYEQIVDGQGKLNDLVAESIDNIRRQEEAKVNQIIDSWIEKGTGIKDLDWMQTEWELINQNADYYLDDVNKAYNIQKLQSKYLEMLDNSNDLAIQNKITEQMKQQLDYLRGKTKLSEYDVQYAQAQLDILQKQIALEEAQKNKSQMKLRRDSQGNYSYTYAANDNNVNQAQQNLLDAQNNAYNMSKDQMVQTQSDSLAALQTAKQQLVDIWLDANLTVEEKTKRMQVIIDNLNQYLAATGEQLSTSEQNIIQDFIGMCESLTEENKGGLEEIEEQIIAGNDGAFSQIDSRWQTSISEWLNHLDNFNAASNEAFSDLQGNAQAAQENISQNMDIAGQSLDSLSDRTNAATAATDALAASSKEYFNVLEDISGALPKAEAELQKYIDQATDAKNEMAAYKQQVDELANRLTAKEQENSVLKGQITAMQNNGGGNSGGSGNGGGGNGGGSPNVATAKAIANSIWATRDKGGWGDDPMRKQRITQRYGLEMYNIVQDMLFNKGYGYHGYDPSYGFQHYDTGGYTGNWFEKTAEAKNGKLAFLHQKELVLNASDTQNILAAVGMMRSIVQGIKNTATSNVSQLFSGLSVTPHNQKIDQNVHITAEFPNVQSSNEIEAALLNLNERAIQYVAKNR